MNDNLDSGSLEDLIENRLQRAYETLEEADYTAKGGYFNAAVNDCIIPAIMQRLP